MTQIMKIAQSIFNTFTQEGVRPRHYVNDDHTFGLSWSGVGMYEFNETEKTEREELFKNWFETTFGFTCPMLNWGLLEDEKDLGMDDDGMDMIVPRCTNWLTFVTPTREECVSLFKHHGKDFDKSKLTLSEDHPFYYVQVMSIINQ